jgi:hypothetical protein
VGFLLTYGIHSSIYVSSMVEVDGGVFTYIWSTLFYLCQLQGGGRWWGFYLHMEYTLLSMSAPKPYHLPPPWG